ncbi:hypothetical protein AWJ14_03645 [Hoeflea olei]|uniref:Uncharacterized protein n=2 Tax=Hoeflea olei TaxID=1480615 RepID=A0A1C1YWN3_9HYPH|nr:hypothetical protein AWJ14_03645 [Hoeflea olei]
MAPSLALGQDAERPRYTPIPSEYGYLQENEALAKAANDPDRAVVRNHAWNLWAGVMQPLDPGDGNSWPIWFSWQTTHQAFSVSGGPPGPVGAQPRRTPAPASHPELAAAKPDLGADVPVNTPQPQYPVPDYVIKTYPGGVTKAKDGSYSVNDGDYFVNNGDIMIAVESLSQAAFDDIRDRKLYLKSTLDKALADGKRMIELPREYVSTKLMYWPVHKDGLTPLPVWTENFPDFYAGYAGYELWNSVVAIDPAAKAGGKQVDVSYLYGVKTAEGIDIPPQHRRADVVPIDRFYHHQVTEQDWKMFSDADKAILNAASLWLTDKPFGVGDYLVTVAAHVNTKEIDSWTLQSVWWSLTPGEGPYAQNRPRLPQAVGPWDQYLMTEAYAYEPVAQGDLPKSVNPYIEGVTHPIATSCRNCHVRGGIGKTGYQTPECYGLLTPLTPESSCFTGALLTDYTWIIPDRAN